MARPGGSTDLDGLLGEPAATQTMAGVVAARLRTAIIDGQLPPGTPLRLASISRQLGVSVMPVREALRQLMAEQLVDVRPHRGAIVSELSVEDAEETYAVRLALEALAARRAAVGLTDDDLDEIRDAFQGMVAAERSGDLRAFIDADRDFHLRIYRTTHRDRLIKNISELLERSRRYAPYIYRAWEPINTGLGLAAHKPILDAIEARDGALVERLTFEHVSAGAVRLIDALRETAEPGTPTDRHRRVASVR